jgi:hypothetical protein
MSAAFLFLGISGGDCWPRAVGEGGPPGGEALLLGALEGCADSTRVPRESDDACSLLDGPGSCLLAGGFETRVMTALGLGAELRRPDRRAG